MRTTWFQTSRARWTFFISAFSLLSAVAHSATTGNLHLEGRIRQLVSIVVTSVSPSSSLDLTVSANGLKVADVQEISNSQTGYRVTLTSANSGNLRNTSSTGQVIKEISYSATYDGQAVSLSNSPQEITRYVNSTGQPSSFTKAFNISYVGSPEESLPSGTYQDDLIFEIAAT